MSGIAPTFATFGKTAEPTEQGKVGFRYLSLSEKRTHKWFSAPGYSGIFRSTSAAGYSAPPPNRQTRRKENCFLLPGAGGKIAGGG